jgi:ubiquinone/menaquinone biosynthesis C-methylase UbiE
VWRYLRASRLVSARELPWKRRRQSLIPVASPFAQHPFYAGMNHSLVQRAIARLDAVRPTGELIRIVDLASGIGAVTQRIMDELERLRRPATVLAIEPANEALQIARERLQGRAVQFVQGDAAQLADVVMDADLDCLCNAIHLLPDTAETVHKIAFALTPGGYFACNTTFFTGAQSPEGERFAHRWIRHAVGWLRRRHPDLHPSQPGRVSHLAVCGRVRRSPGGPGLARG